MSQLIVYGNVSAEGTKLSGSGFDVTPDSTSGVYLISFDKKFSNIPAVVATALYTAGPAGSVATSLELLEQGKVKIVTADAGNVAALPFSFNAIGEE